jgi:hypothetical protein
VALASLNATQLSCDADFVLPDAEQNFVSNFDTERFQERSWDQDIAVLIYTNSNSLV